METFIGTILPWPLTYAPQGWAFCNGQSLSVNQNQSLYSLIGNLYGGDNRTFKLPNLTGRFPVGSVNMGGSIPSTVQAQLATYSGYKEITLKATQLPVHSHAITNAVNATGGGNIPVSVNVKIPVNTDAYDATKATNVPGTTATLGQGKAGSFTTNIYTSNAPTADANLAPFNAQGTISIPSPTVTVTSTCTGQTPTQSQTVPTVPPFLAINYIIALEGVYPMRP